MSSENWTEDLAIAKEDLGEYRLSKQPSVFKAPTKSLQQKVAPPLDESRVKKTLPHPTRSKSAGLVLREGNNTVD
jgi:hypothetical protein